MRSVTDETREKLVKGGSRGGRANTAAQKETRRLNAYRVLAMRYPNSVKVRQELARLEGKSNESV